MATAAKPAIRPADHRYYYACALGFALVVFVGFSRTYYLKGWFEAEPLPLLLHIHGVAMTLWYLLFVAQVALVERRRVGLHRKLGWAGVALAAAVVVLDTLVSIGLAKRRLAVNPNSQGAPFLLGMQLLAVLMVFVVLIALAVYWRRRPDYHKRAMTLAMIAVIGPAITRLPGLPNHEVAPAIAVNVALLVLCIVADTVIKRRLHPVFGWGGSAMIAVMFVLAQFCQTSLWMNFARGMLRRL